MQKQLLPDWFTGTGTIYEEGGKITGRSSEEVCELNNLELSFYDFVAGSAILYNMGSRYRTKGMKQEIKLGIQWFKENNTKAHQILLEAIEYAKDSE